MRKELVTQKEPKSPVSEVFRTLRTNIQFMNSNKKLKTLLITSTSPEEGKSWVSSNLAVTFAQAGKKVILVDADMRKGRQYSIFGALPKPGLSNYLSGIDDNEEDKNNIQKYLQSTDVENLSLMVAGNIPPNPSELLISSQMIELVEKLKEISDIVIIDGTPCELVTDSVILSRLVDSTVILTAHEETKRENLQRTITSIKNVGGTIAGIVVNKMPVSMKKYKESYYYGSTNTKKTKKRSNRQNAIQGRRNSKEMKNRLETDRRNIEKKIANANEEKIKEPKIEVEIKEEEKIENILEPKTNNILKQINEYLEKEKKDIEG